jgi:hypothetical protein
VKSLVDLRLVEEARASALRFCCDDCLHFDAAIEACVHGYPSAPHRPGTLTPGMEVTFCKEFELGAGGDTA